MELRYHPAMSYHGIANWPPVWTQVRNESVATVKGELGVLTHVYGAYFGSRRCYLVIEHDKQSYVGCLLFNDPGFCMYISSFLRHRIGCTIAEIGNHDFSATA